jgi:2-oxo-4-hydroxy-4-carboxy-5-ureidoimidazoline decarboxylase
VATPPHVKDQVRKSAILFVSMPSLTELNNLPPDQATTEFLKCCGSSNWARQMVTSRPFSSIDQMCANSSAIWNDLDRDDWLEAFRKHPKIGQKKAETKVDEQSHAWSSQEQSRIADAQQVTLNKLARLNREYEEKFGYIYIVCATGKSSEEMLEILKSRMGDQPDEELRIAAGEQEKITELRLRKLIED